MHWLKPTGSPRWRATNSRLAWLEPELNVLLTGGTGYIGSHAAVVLAEAGHEVVLYDNLCNSEAKVVASLETICGGSLTFVHGDVRDTSLLGHTLVEYRADAVMHFAGLKAVGESTQIPLSYYDNNIGGTISLLHAMETAGTRRLVFSSSATVYGEPRYLPLDEAHPTHATNPYGRNKLHIDEMLSDVAAAYPDWRIASLRYFNPVGAHEGGLIGDNPKVPNNLMPYVARVAAGLLPELHIFGNNYPTPDGTGVRDYIHVMDLAEGHLAALRHFESENESFSIYNLGAGRGYSVMEILRAFEQASGCKIPHRVTGRRAGDVATNYAEPGKAAEELGWRAQRDLHAMCESAWHFQQQHCA